MDAQASTLGGWLLLELNRRGMSQNDLAAALGVERPAVTKWINGRNRPDIESIVALADFFQVPITVILSKIGIEVDAARVRLPTNQAAGVTVPRVRRVSANPDDWWREAESVSTYVPTAPGTYGRRRLVEVISDAAWFGGSIRPGDAMLVDVRADQEEGCLVVTLERPAGMVRRVERRADGTALVADDGQAISPEQVTVLGVIIRLTVEGNIGDRIGRA